MNFSAGYSLFLVPCSLFLVPCSPSDWRQPGGLVGYSSWLLDILRFRQQKSRPKTAPVENLPTHEIISVKGNPSLYPYAQ
jgi:hypothetical protein